MKVIKQRMTLLKIENKKGTGKTSGKPYDFDTATLIDDEANVLALNFAKGVDYEKLRESRNVEVVVDLEIKPKGFDLGGTVTAISIAK